MESIALRIKDDNRPYGGTMYRLNVAFEAQQCTADVVVDQYMSRSGVPPEYIARQLVEAVVADVRKRLLKKVLSVL